jgi:hypothetical protein
MILENASDNLEELTASFCRVKVKRASTSQPGCPHLYSNEG